MDPVVDLLDWVLVKTRRAASVAVEAFQKQFHKALLPHIPAQHMPVLVHDAYNVVTQFHMIVWRMVADECIMPIRHTYLSLFSLVTVMQHALEKIPSTCMMNIPPHSLEHKDELSTFLDSFGGSMVLQVPAMPITSSMVSPSGCSLTGAPDVGGSSVGRTQSNPLPIFGGAPGTAVSASTSTGISLFSCGIAPPPRFLPLPVSEDIPSTSSAATSMPKVSGALAGLPVSIPITLTDPIQVGKHALVSNMVGLDEEGNTAVDEELREIVGEVTH